MFSRDGRRLLTATVGGAAQVWESDSRTAVGPPLRHPGVLTCAALRPDGQQVITGGDDGSVRIWNAETGDLVVAPLMHPSAVGQAAFSPNGQMVLTRTEKAIRLWSLHAAAALLVRLNHPREVLDLSFSQDGGRLLTLCRDGAVRLWDLETGRGLMSPLVSSNAVVFAALSGDAQKVVTVGADHTVRVWEAATGRPLSRPLEHGRAVKLAALSPDSARLVTAATWTDDKATNQTELRMWRCDTGEALGSVSVTGPPPVSIAFDPSGARIEVVQADGQVRAWNCPAATPAEAPVGRARWHAEASYSPNLRLEVRVNGTVARLHETASGKPVTPPIRHRAEVRCARFSPNGRLLATADADAAVAVWDATSGDPMAPPMRFGPSVANLRFSPDSRNLVVIAEPGTAWVWPLKPRLEPVEDLVRLAQLLTGYRLDGTGTLAPLDSDDLKNTWDSLRQSHPAEFLPAVARVLAALRQDAAIAETNHLWAEVRQRLTALELAEPTNWSYAARQAFACAHPGQWQEAAAGFSRAMDLGGSQAAMLPFLVDVHLARGDTNAHRETCVQLLELTRTEAPVGFGKLAAWLCALSPLPSDTTAAALRVAEKYALTNPGDARGLTILGALHFRAGQLDLARRRLEAVLADESSDSGVSAALFLAMLERQAGKPAEARRRFDWAYWQMADRLEAARLVRSGSDGVEVQATAAIGWEEQVEFEVVAAQARGASGEDDSAEAGERPRVKL